MFIWTLYINYRIICIGNIGRIAVWWLGAATWLTQTKASGIDLMTQSWRSLKWQRSHWKTNASVESTKQSFQTAVSLHNLLEKKQHSDKVLLMHFFCQLLCVCEYHYVEWHISSMHGHVCVSSLLLVCFLWYLACEWHIAISTFISAAVFCMSLGYLVFLYFVFYLL